MNARLPVIALATTLVTMLLAGCATGEERASSLTPVSTMSEAATPKVTAEATRGPTSASLRHTGIEGVDAVIDAVLAGDFDTLRGLVGFTQVACSTTSMHGTPCDPGEADGTLVDAFPMAAGLGLYYRSDAVDAFLRVLLSDKLSLYAVYVAPPDFWPEGDYVVMFSRDVAGTGVIGEELVIKDDHLVGAKHGHPFPPERVVQLEQLDEVILPPP